MGLRKKEWLFTTSLNHWIVCRLVRDDGTPYLAYSPMPNVKESSETFRAFIGAVLSVVKDVSVESSPYNPNIELDTIEEEGDDGPLSEREYQDSSGTGAITPPITRSRDRNSCGNTESDLLVHTFLDRYRSLGSLTFRLRRLLPTRLKTSKYGHV